MIRLGRRALYWPGERRLREDIANLAEAFVNLTETYMTERSRRIGAESAMIRLDDAARDVVQAYDHTSERIDLAHEIESLRRALPKEAPHDRRR